MNWTRSGLECVHVDDQAREATAPFVTRYSTTLTFAKMLFVSYSAAMVWSRRATATFPVL